MEKGASHIIKTVNILYEIIKKWSEVDQCCGVDIHVGIVCFDIIKHGCSMNCA